MDRPTPVATEENAPQAKALPVLPGSGETVEVEVSTDEAALKELYDAGNGPVMAAVLMELAALGVDWRLSARAATALEMARQLDWPNSATAKSMCAGRLQEAMDRLLELNPPQQEDNPLDGIKKVRLLRIAEATA